MYFGNGTTKLQHAVKTLRQTWEATEDDWRDSIRAEFEANRIDPMAAQAALTMRAMDTLADLFARIYRDCS